jgi:hypothetical protein
MKIPFCKGIKQKKILTVSSLLNTDMKGYRCQELHKITPQIKNKRGSGLKQKKKKNRY